MNLFIHPISSVFIMGSFTYYVEGGGGLSSRYGQYRANGHLYGLVLRGGRGFKNPINRVT
jgi:hypothetical protein